LKEVLVKFLGIIIIIKPIDSAVSAGILSLFLNFFRQMLWLRRYERISVQNQVERVAPPHQPFVFSEN